MARTTTKNEMTMDYLHKPIDEITTEEVEIRESWYNESSSEILHFYNSYQRQVNLSIHSNKEVPLDKSRWIDVPGTKTRYRCDIYKEANNIVVALMQRLPKWGCLFVEYYY